MKRVFIQTISGRYKVGMIKDWPMTTWNGIADNLKMPLESFSRPLAEPTSMNVTERADGMIPKRGPGRPRKDEAYAL